MLVFCIMQSLSSIGQEVLRDGRYIKFNLLDARNASDGHVFALEE